MIAGFWVALACAILWMPALPTEQLISILSVALGATLIGIVGLLGDMKVISSRVELFLELFPALVALFLGLRLGFVPLAPASIALTLFYLVGGSCAVNLQDGMDGLASGVALIAAAFFAFLAFEQGNTPVALLSLTLLGSCLGFLPHNLPRARVFMGDVGSLFAGFILAAQAILLSQRPYDFTSFMASILVIGMPVFDTFLAIVRRALNRGDVLAGDRRHFYDLLRAKGWSDRATLMTMYTFCSFFGGSALIMTRAPFALVLGLASFNFALFLGVAFRFGAFRR